MITFNQILRGRPERKRELTLVCSEEVETKALELQARGCFFEIEFLKMGQVILSIEQLEFRSKYNGSLTKVICENNGEIQVCVGKLMNLGLQTLTKSE